MWNATAKIQGQTDTPLDETGKLQAKKAAIALENTEFKACFSSPLQRALNTAQIVLEGRGLTIETDPLLMEISFGIFEGENFDLIKNDPDHQLYKFFFNSFDYEASNGAESICHLMYRNLQFLNRMMSLDFQCQDKILVCTHGAFVRGLINLASCKSIGEFWKTKALPNCGLMVMDADSKGYRVIHELIDLVAGELP